MFVKANLSGEGGLKVALRVEEILLFREGNHFGEETTVVVFRDGSTAHITQDVETFEQLIKESVK
ncbi:hypothetical protein [Escherichia phage vB_EcoM-LTH01]